MIFLFRAIQPATASIPQPTLVKKEERRPGAISFVIALLFTGATLAAWWAVILSSLDAMRDVVTKHRA